MSDTKLFQRIREVAKALQNARDANDALLVEELEDELFELEHELEETQRYEYDEKHQHGWN